MKYWAALLVATLAGAASAQDVVRDPAESSCAEGAIRMLILGTYHMDNPGLDESNVDADDVLSARRQAEIAELNQALLRFRPTKIAIEGDRARTVWQDRYRSWIAGQYTLGRNEIEQIGMKVARAAGHETIYPIDFPMLMSGLRYDEIDLTVSARASTSGEREQVPSAEDQELRRSSVAQYLRRLNDPERIAASHASYLELLAPDPDDPELYGRADRLLSWYKRNIRMMTNVARISEPEDRVLLIVGAGHLAILREFAIDSPYACLADTLQYLPPSN